MLLIWFLFLHFGCLLNKIVKGNKKEMNLINSKVGWTKFPSLFEELICSITTRVILVLHCTLPNQNVLRGWSFVTNNNKWFGDIFNALNSFNVRNCQLSNCLSMSKAQKARLIVCFLRDYNKSRQTSKNLANRRHFFDFS